MSSGPRPRSRCWPAPMRSPPQGRSIINLGIGQPDFPTPEHIVEAGRKALADGHHGYTPANGIPPLRAAVAADLLRRHGVEVSPDLVLVVPGGKVTMFFAILMFGEPGRRDPLPQPRVPDLRERDPVFRRDAGADPAARERRASRSAPTRCSTRSRRAPGSSSSTARPTRPAASCRGTSSTGWSPGSSGTRRSRC